MRALEKYDDGEDAEGWALRLDGIAEPVVVSRRQLAAVREALQGRRDERARGRAAHDRHEPRSDGAAEPQRPAGPPSRTEPERVLLHMPVDVRSASLVVIAVLAGVFALHWAAAVFIPLMLSLLLTYALSPLVDLLERWQDLALDRRGRRSCWASAAALGWTGYSLSGSAAELLDSLPVAAQKLRQAVRSSSSTDPSALDTVQKAAAQLEQAAEENSAKVAARKGVARVVIERPGFNVRDYLLERHGRPDRRRRPAHAGGLPHLLRARARATPSGASW